MSFQFRYYCRATTGCSSRNRGLYCVREELNIVGSSDWALIFLSVCACQPNVYCAQVAWASNTLDTAN
jgi:hypothetical protein